MKQPTFFPLPSESTRRGGSRFRVTLGLIATSVTTLLTLALSSPVAHAQTFNSQTLYSFSGMSPDGGNPQATLTDADINGTELLYGTTYQGGSHSSGTLFSINPVTGTETTLLSLGGTSNQQRLPTARMIVANGLLYGTTLAGGDSDYGTLFSYNPATNTITTLHSFSNTTTDGARPQGELLNINGVLYGVTSGAGANGSGAIYTYNLSTNTYKLLYSFGNTTDAQEPESGLTLVNGVLFGTGSSGGNQSEGAIFSINTDGTSEQVLYNFQGVSGSDGSDPQGALILLNGLLYGTTNNGSATGYGTVFTFNPSTHAYQIIYSFLTNTPDGANPYGTLVASGGLLYGTLSIDGNFGAGAVYSINPNGSNETLVHSFKGDTTDGSDPMDGVISVNGAFYGTTQYSGANGQGTAYALIPTNATAPTAKNDTGRGIANHTIIVAGPGVLANDTTGNGGIMAASLVTGPSHGEISFHSDGGFNYTPNTGYVGADSFTYKVANAIGTSNTATCSLTIGPIAYNDNGRTYFNTAVTINAPGVLANDVTGGLSTTASLVTSPAHGTIAFNSDGSFKYTPTNGFQGTDSFTYKITNAGGISAPATCTMLVQARTPVANNDAGRVTHNTTLTITAPGVLGNDNPGSTGTVTTSLVTNVSHGTLTFNNNGSFVYKPTTGFIGTDSFTYKDTNSVGSSNTATCTITVQ